MADADLAAIFAMPLTGNFELLLSQAPTELPMAPDLAAAQAALTNGADWRTIALPSGQRVRLFSEPASDGKELAVSSWAHA